MITTDIDPRIVRDLDQLGRLERTISRRRRRLHDEIDELYLAAPLDDAQMAELDELEETEQAVSRSGGSCTRRSMSCAHRSACRAGATSTDLDSAA